MTHERPIYLDNNATTPVDPRVLEAMLPYLREDFGNAASRTHAYGWDAEKAVETGRRQVAELLGAKPSEIVFTSGATESTNLALKGLFERHSGKRDGLVTAVTEHKATLDVAKHLEPQGARVTRLGVDREGFIDLAQLAASVDEHTLVVSIMAVNNESGVIQPLAEIGAICADRGAVFHCDIAQAFGKIPLD
ncbi:MAG: aminotransferase class V-fold PLP-dependent enzyme, partial [Planctomycetes bacterium]|nr:aminotransferase class V-fold PLP-dependent enzyme [Planctomycetota bacterium]